MSALFFSLSLLFEFVRDFYFLNFQMTRVDDINEQMSRINIDDEENE